MLKYIDDQLIEKVFQPIADWATETSGKDVFWVALVALNINLLSGSTHHILQNNGQLNGNVAMSFATWLLIAFSLGMYKGSVKNSYTANPLRLFFWPVRIAMLFALGIFTVFSLYLLSQNAIGWLVAILRTVESSSFVACLYLMACTSKPKKPRRNRKEVLSPALKRA